MLPTKADASSLYIRLLYTSALLSVACRCVSLFTLPGALNGSDPASPASYIMCVDKGCMHLYDAELTS